ncbi:toxin 44 [Paucidesulfovibrio gracilis DSM 16080]|uniref:Toxin 44 n=1 Tax=Paucidesulfovibrio gracilis DSM 16080 TaxID=1121449 RepID=A0A1T4XXV7_9BACT|nr:polymorphic toxin type 44 domain-containing protein [Paucidesulfovibrio gracilis]SKA94409.1 toxin 44 [Paucidesulfovibrio gracilis DSM 16080]
MSGHWNQHIGDDQLVYGMPKHMSAVAGSGNEATYWRYHPKPQACDKCQAMKGLWFDENPGRVHPNCRCEIEEFRAIKVTGRAEGILVPPGVDLAANIAEARRVKRICDAFILNFPPYSSASFSLKCAWVVFKFSPGADYDFKKDGHPEYEDFGNYHYGLYTEALGLNATFTQAAAGFVQLCTRTSSWDFEETWFDDPRDNAMVRKGQGSPLLR